MDTFLLRYRDDGIGGAKTVEFEGPDASKALAIAHQEAQGRSAELWQGERKLCTLKRTGVDGEIWAVS